MMEDGGWTRPYSMTASCLVCQHGQMRQENRAAQGQRLASSSIGNPPADVERHAREQKRTRGSAGQGRERALGAGGEQLQGLLRRGDWAEHSGGRRAPVAPAQQVPLRLLRLLLLLQRRRRRLRQHGCGLRRRQRRLPILCRRRCRLLLLHVRLLLRLLRCCVGWPAGDGVCKELLLAGQLRRVVVRLRQRRGWAAAAALLLRCRAALGGCCRLAKLRERICRTAPQACMVRACAPGRTSISPARSRRVITTCHIELTLSTCAHQI
jgi:hypothetical protein